MDKSTGTSDLLEVRNVSVNYGGIQALNDVSISVGKGHIVSILGANGAGKSTLLRAICGLVRPKEGDIFYEGDCITKTRTARIARKGLVMQAEGHPTFPAMSVKENLKLAYNALPRNERKSGAAEIDKVIEMFPILGERFSQNAGTLSGGEQQMLSIARGLISKPKVMLMDEPSLGLAPLIISQIFRTIIRIKESGVTIVLVEQNANAALKCSDTGYVLEKGRVVMQGAASKLLMDDRIRKVYLGEV
jgi:branched-chain amino acid transport system ATP-binding protein